MRQKDRTIVSAVLMSKDQKVLLGKVRVGGVYPDCWHIPGGGIEDGESKETALIREISEETGIDISPYSVELISDQNTGEAVKTEKETGEQFLVKMSFFVYRVNLDKEASDIDISLNDDLTEYQWVPLAELKKYKHTPPSEMMFKELGWI